MPCQVVFNKMSLHPITGELKDFKKLEKKLISKIIILKKKEAIIHRKGKFVKVNGGICNVPVEKQIYAIFCQELQVQTDCLRYCS